MKKNCILTLAFGLTGTCFVHSQTIPPDPDLRIGKLSNGITYYIRHNTIPKERADFYLVQKVGSVLEEENQRGLAHFLEHMAFNGSASFPGNTMITELEKKGIKFGRNINAYTSFDETVYKLTEIPVTRDGITDTALLVLHDWSGFLTLNDKDIDEERGVVREEWRISASGRQRIYQNQIFPAIFKGTPYGNRLPIGSIDVINNFKYQELRDYYKKWYRPDLQGIVIVGDIDAVAVEEKIKKIFGSIPAPVNPAPRNYITTPDNKDPLIVYGTDKEVSGLSFTILWKLKPETPTERSSYNWYKKRQINQVIASLLTSRFGKLREEPNTPISYVAVSPTNRFLYDVSRPGWQVSVSTINKQSMKAALKMVFTEIERMHRFGFSAEELQDLKKTTMNRLETEYNDRDKRTNYEFISDNINFFLDGIPNPGIDWEYKESKSILSGLSLDTVNYYAKQILGDENIVIYGSAQDEDSMLLTPASQIIQDRKEIKEIILTPAVYKAPPTQILVKQPVPGKIKKEERAKFDFTKWTLSNGATVYFKRTDYKEDLLLLRGIGTGGYYDNTDEDLPSAMFAPNLGMGGFGNYTYSEMGKLDGGRKLSVNTDLDEFTKNIDAGSSLKDAEDLFRMLYLKMTSPRKDTNYFNSWKKSTRERFTTRLSVPDNVFKDSVKEIMGNYHPRNISLESDSVAFEKIDLDKAVRIYKEQFGDASKFTFYITGNIAEDTMRKFVTNYLAALPSTFEKQNVKDHGIYAPEGVVKKEFNHEMTTPRTNTMIAFTGKGIPVNQKNRVLVEYMQSLLTMAYTKTMREEEGGVYYTGVYAWLNRKPTPNYTVRIEYSSDPEKREKLKTIVYDQINKMMSELVDAENIEKTKLNLIKTRREWSSEQNANYWNYVASEYYDRGLNMQEYEKQVNAVTPEMIRDFAKKLFGHPNVTEVIMNPVPQDKNKKAF